tara:strand:- start:421 stop:639 length:219 start_codon:yes stop_codon:yes gene_type:complete
MILSEGVAMVAMVAMVAILMMVIHMVHFLMVGKHLLIILLEKHIFGMKNLQKLLGATLTVNQHHHLLHLLPK